MKTVDIYFNSSEKDFRRDCKKKKIHTKIVKRGSGVKHCTGAYTYRWIETSEPNYDMYISYLEHWASVEVFFYTEDDRTKFIEELSKKVKFKVMGTSNPDLYYKMENLYGVYSSYDFYPLRQLSFSVLNCQFLKFCKICL